MLKFVASSMSADRKYKVTIQSNSVVNRGGDTNDKGPAQDYTFYVTTDSNNYIPLQDGHDQTAPTVISNGYKPSDQAGNVAPDSSITLWFNEDVQSGAHGTVSFCTNSDATAGPAHTQGTATAACTAAVNTVDMPVNVDSSSFNFYPRRAVINPSHDFKIGQKVYMVMPEGAIRDAAANPLAKIDGKDYSFTVKDMDTVRPHISYVTAPEQMRSSAKNGKVLLSSVKQCRRRAILTM